MSHLFFPLIWPSRGGHLALMRFHKTTVKTARKDIHARWFKRLKSGPSNLAAFSIYRHKTNVSFLVLAEKWWQTSQRPTATAAPLALMIIVLTLLLTAREHAHVYFLRFEAMLLLLFDYRCNVMRRHREWLQAESAVVCVKVQAYSWRCVVPWKGTITLNWCMYHSKIYHKASLPAGYLFRHLQNAIFSCWTRESSPTNPIRYVQHKNPLRNRSTAPDPR